MPSKKICFDPSDKTLNKFSLLTGILIVVSPFLHFFSMNALDSVFNKTLFLQFSLMAIATIVVLVVPATFIISRFLLHTAFYRLFPIFYAGFFYLFLYIPFRHLLLILGGPQVVRFIYIIFMPLLFWIIYRLSKVRKFHLVLLVFALVLAAGPIVRIVHSTVILSDRGTDHDRDYKNEWVAQISKKTINQADLPNIYYVVPDGYTSVAVLHDELSFDNMAFIEEMKERGFVHLPDSFSSYTNTHLTVASLLQADYPVNEDSPRYKSRENFYPSILYKSTPPSLIRAARHLGYTFSIVGNFIVDCGGPHVSCYEDQKYYIPYEIQAFLEMTPFARLLRRIKTKNLSFDESVGVDAITRTITYLRSGNFLKRPYFMLIHHLSPHDPYIFESDCRVRSNTKFDYKSGDERFISLYLDNLQCTNKKLMEFADYIASIDPTALIAIQADHGSWLPIQKFSGVRFKDLPKNVIRDCVSVLSLVRAPDECRKWLRPDLNTVNTVRFLFGCATGTEPIYLENKSYMSFYESNPDYGHVYRVRR